MKKKTEKKQDPTLQDAIDNVLNEMLVSDKPIQIPVSTRIKELIYEAESDARGKIYLLKCIQEFLNHNSKEKAITTFNRIIDVLQNNQLIESFDRIRKMGSSARSQYRRRVQRDPKRILSKIDMLVAVEDSIFRPGVGETIAILNELVKFLKGKSING